MAGCGPLAYTGAVTKADDTATQPIDTPPTSETPSTPLLPLRRNRDFMLLWTSQVVSTVGTRVTSVAYPLLVLALTHSPSEAGIVGFAQTLPFLLLYLPGGALVDRWDRKRTMVVCDGGRALALGSVSPPGCGPTSGRGWRGCGGNPSCGPRSASSAG